MCVAFSSILALGAAGAIGRARMVADTASHVTQFCIPSNDNDPGAHRLYCRDGSQEPPQVGQTPTGSSISIASEWACPSGEAYE
jgi:hypothetical protein